MLFTDEFARMLGETRAGVRVGEGVGLGRMDLLRFATAGSVDDGKSTLIGRLLHDCKALFDDQIATQVAAFNSESEIGSQFLVMVTAKPGRDPNQPIDEAYTAGIKKHTTETFFLSPLVDYMPASKTVPATSCVPASVSSATSTRVAPSRSATVGARLASRFPRSFFARASARIWK